MGLEIFMEDLYVMYHRARDSVMGMFKDSNYRPSEEIHRTIYRMKKGISPKPEWGVNPFGEIEQKY